MGLRAGTLPRRRLKPPKANLYIPGTISPYSNFQFFIPLNLLITHAEELVDVARPSHSAVKGPRFPPRSATHPSTTSHLNPDCDPQPSILIFHDPIPQDVQRTR